MMDHEDGNKLPMAEWANFPLTPCCLVKLQQHYYAIGNNPARNIFYRNDSLAFEHVKPMELKSWRYHTFDPSFEQALKKSSKQVEDLHVLCLACGDLRNILFSLGSSTGLGTIELVINDYDVHVLARNVLLLDMIFDIPKQEGEDETIFAIWFSTGLYKHQLSSLHDRLRKLIRQVDEHQSSDGKTCWTWRCYEPGLLSELQGVWQKWLDFFANVGVSVAGLWEETQRRRHTTFLERYLKLLAKPKAQESGSVASRLREHIQTHRMSSVRSHCAMHLGESTLSSELRSKWKEECETHLLTGVFLVGNSASTSPDHYCVNPTFFYREDSYDLHYGTDSFSAFPFFLPSKDSTVVEHCFEVFKTWLDNARENRERLSWTFSCLDCQTLCLNFDPKTVGLNKRPIHESIIAEDEMTTLFQGALVVTHGLRGSPSLNRCIGVVTRKVPEEGRWGVQIFKKLPFTVCEEIDPANVMLPKKPVSLKRSNMLLMTPACGLLHPTKSSAYFDVISTSNVADHIGLSTLLLLSRPLLVPGGTLLTTSFLHQDRFGSTMEYLKASLLDSSPEWWSTLFGFRAMGYESCALTSSACGLSHTDFEVIGVTGSGRTDSTVVWLANDVNSNIPLATEGRLACHLMELIQNTHESNKARYLDGKAAVVLCRLAARKLLSSSEGSRFERSCLGEVLTRNLGQHVGAGKIYRGGRQTMLCSFEVEDATLRRVFCSQTSSPTPTLFVKVNGIEILGLWLLNSSWRSTEKAHRFFFWCMHDIMEAADWSVDLHSTAEPFGIMKSLTDVRVEQWDVCKKKLHNAASLLAGSRESHSSSEGNLSSFLPSGDADAASFDMHDLVRFELHDESSTHFIIHVQPRVDIFGKCVLSTDSFRIKQSNKGGASRFALNLTVRIPCMPSDGSTSCNAIVDKQLIFSTPVSCSGWKFQVNSGLLEIPKSKHGLFSTVRRSMIPGCVYPNNPESRQLDWTDSSLKMFSGAQFTARERSSRHRKDNSSDDYQMSMVTEVKDSITELLQLKDRLIYLHMKEPGIGFVGFVIRHGLLMNCQKGVPILDLSVCFLSSETSLEMANAVLHIHMNDPNGDIIQRIVKMWTEEYRMFQNICNYTRATMAPELRAEHPSLSRLIKKKSSRSNFRRVLLPPLFPSAADSEAGFEAALGISLHRMLNFFG
jgi:hypothetical protein